MQYFDRRTSKKKIICGIRGRSQIILKIALDNSVSKMEWILLTQAEFYCR
jgi:hypothetical protein